MSAARTVVVFVPSDPGKGATDQLAPIAARFDHAEVSVVTAGGAPPLIEGLPGLRTRTLEELQRLELAESLVVLLDARGAPPLEMAGWEGIAELERRLLLERAVAAMRRGVRIRDPRTVYIRGELAGGANVEIEANVILEGRVVLGDGVKVGAGSLIRSSTIGERTRVNPFSIVEDSTVGRNGFVGPYGRIRPGCSIGDEVQIGNYVEIKSAQIGARCRINHHSFIGDAVVGERVTIGAGTITCNHDGVGTNQTVIEHDVTIGSGCNLVAPVRIGEGATVGAGSTINRDVPARKLTLARSPQTTVEGWRGPRTRRTEK